MRKWDFEEILHHMPGKRQLQNEIDSAQWEREFCYINFSGVHRNLQKKDWKLDLKDDEERWYQYIMFSIISKSILGESEKLLTNKKMLTVKSQKIAKLILSKLEHFSNYETVFNEFCDVELEILQKFARSSNTLL